MGYAVDYQNFNLFEHLTILDNVTMCPMILLGKSREEAESRGSILSAVPDDSLSLMMVRGMSDSLSEPEPGRICVVI